MKYHINAKDEVRICRASKRTCRFGKSEHFTLKAEADAEVERRLSKFVDKNDLDETKTHKKVQKERNYIDITKDDLSQLSSSERADLAIFSAMIVQHSNDTYVGDPNTEWFGGGYGATVDEATTKKLRSLHILDMRLNSFSVQSLFRQGFRVHFVKNSLKEYETNHFLSTFADDSESIMHMNAQAVIEARNGYTVEVPITTTTTFSELLRSALQSEDYTDYKEDLLTKAIISNADLKSPYEY